MPAGTLKLACSVCGSVQSKARHGDQCQHGCYVITNCLEWDGQKQRVKFRRHELVGFCARYRTFDELTKFVRTLPRTLAENSP